MRLPRLPDLRARRIARLNLRHAFPELEPITGASAATADEVPARLRTVLARSRPSPSAMGVGAVVLAVAFVAAMTFYGARTFSRRAADTRASNEASSLARHSGTLATGDAFDGYIQILRFADDPVVHSKASPRDDRVVAMRQLLLLNVNKFASLTIADRSGTVLATTDPSITTVKGSPTFLETRANLAPANSDVILPAPGTPGYVEYTVALKDADGTTWGVLAGRADPARIWKGTLDASVDGSRNVIINSEGLFATGVPDKLLGQPWRGSAVGDGGVRATIAGVDSICGLAPIGRDTQIDRGLNVASCLPTSVIQAEHGAAMGKQGLVTLAGAVLAIVLAGGALLVVSRGSPSAAARATDATATGAAAAAEDTAIARVPEPAEELATPAAEAEPVIALEVAAEIEAAVPDTKESEAEAPLPQPGAAPAQAIGGAPALAVDALTLIEAYEQRNARLSERLRETVQAKLLVAAAQADEAYRLVKDTPDDTEAADKLHAHVMLELERLRDQDLRSIGQELHPGLIRLGLPGALRSLRKELDGTVDVRLDVDPTTDSVGQAAGRAAIPSGQRLALYRLAEEATRALADAGASACTVALRREGDLLVLEVSGTTSDAATGRIERSMFAASALAAEAYGGYLSVRRQDDRVMVSIEVPTRPVTEMPPVDLAAWERAALEDGGPDNHDAGADDDDADADAAGSEDAALPEAGEAQRVPAIVAEMDIVSALERLRDESGDAPAVTLDLALLPQPERIGLPQRKTAYELARVTVDALRLSGAQRCIVSVKHGSDTLTVSIVSESGGRPFDGAHIKPVEAAIEALGGYVAVSRRDNAVSVTAEIMAPAELAGEGELAPERSIPSEDAA